MNTSSSAGRQSNHAYSQEVKGASSIGDTLDTLISQADKMGLTPEARELTDKFDECRDQLNLKVAELSIIEAIAMESTDENIKDLREQLFTVVKLIHADSITEIMDEYTSRENKMGSPSVYHDDSHKSQEIEPDSNSISKYDVLERIRKYLNNRSRYKELKEMVKKGQ